jgi:hypothetical protein
VPQLPWLLRCNIAKVEVFAKVCVSEEVKVFEEEDSQNKNVDNQKKNQKEQAKIYSARRKSDRLLDDKSNATSNAANFKAPDEVYPL